MSTRPIVMISDLHLCPSDAATAQLFAHFLNDIARKAQALYILGDFFDVWIGDEQLQWYFYHQQLQQLARIAQRGIALYFIPGNRDFLCGNHAADAAGWQVLPDPCRVAAFGTVLLLSHGDRYCTRDWAYQCFRAVTRHRLFLSLWQRLPFCWRQHRILKFQRYCKRAKQGKSDSMMEVTSAAVMRDVRRARVVTLVHGHTHRCAQHHTEWGQRWVLPAWERGRGGYLKWDPTGLSLFQIAL